MIDMNRFRMPNVTNTGGTGYRIYDTFMDKVLPGIRGARAGNRAYAESLDEKDRDFQREKWDRDAAQNAQSNRLAFIANMQQQQRPQPMNVQIDRSQEITPWQRAQLDLRRSEIDRKSEWDEVRAALQGDTLEETIRKNMAAEQNKRDSIAVQKFRAEHPNAREVRQPNGSILFADPITGKTIANFGPSGEIGEGEKIEKKADADIKVNAEKAAAEQRERVANAWTTINVPGPDGKMTSYRYNPILNETQALNTPAGTSGPVEKIGTTDTGGDTKANEAKADRLAKLEVLRNQAREAISTIDTISTTDKDGNLTLKPEMQWNVGWSNLPSKVMNLFPFDSREAQGTANRLKKETVLNLIGEMKSQSKTGATGFGALNLKELETLEKAANQLDEGGSEAAYARELSRIRQRLEWILMKGDDEKSTTTTTTPSAGGSAGGRTAAQRIAEIEAKLKASRGGRP